MKGFISKYKYFFILLLFVSSTLLIYHLSKQCGLVCRATRLSSSGTFPGYVEKVVRKYMQNERVTATFHDEEIDVDADFNRDDDGILVVLHIQKTGGSYLERRLVHRLNISEPCVCERKKTCNCVNKNGKIWQLSRYTISGKRCGLHADWTEWTECMNKVVQTFEGEHRHRRFYLITSLRDPVKRYLSEWRHVQSGASWSKSFLSCNNHSYRDEYPTCFTDDNWLSMPLKEFMECPYNLANNRQTRMLANLSLVDCFYNTKPSDKRDRILLESAKENLRALPFFSLLERQEDSQMLFEETFKLSFSKDWEQKPPKPLEIDDQTKEKIINLNKLDIALYKFAEDLFEQRIQALRKKVKSQS